MPKYTSLEAVAAMETPKQIADWEASAQFTRLCEHQAGVLTTAAAKAPASHPFFFSALLPEDKGLLTVQSRTGLLSRCGALFTSEIRVAVYGDLLFGGLKLTPINFTPAVFVETLARLSNVGIRHFVLDRCPRCWSFEVCSNVSISGTESAVAHWALIKAAEMTRANYYLQLARHHSGSGAYAESRDIALYAVAHVAPDDARFHEHLLTVAEQLADKVLQLEAKAAVRCSSSPAWIAAISQDMELQITGSVLRI